MITFGTVATPEIMEIVSIVEELRNTSSTNGKIEILKNNIENEGLKTALWMAYNPFRKYKITEKVLEEGLKDAHCADSLNILLHLLATSNINDRLRQDVNNFLEQTDEKLRDFYRCIILKDLKIGVNTTTINKIWKGLIPTSESGVEIKPMLASKFDFEKPPKTDFAVTEKLDGIRCVAICKESGIQLYTRQGKLIEGCLTIENHLSKLRQSYDCEFVLDGEILATDCDYATVYKETTKRVKNKNLVKTGLCFMAFDMLDIKEFEQLKCETPYYKRLETLIEIGKHIEDNDVIKIIQPLYIGNDLNRVLQLLEEYRLKGAEGLMVNLMDAPYEFKRSKSILKVKVMQTVDLRIIGFEEGQGRNEGKLGALLVDFKGNTVGVGSGFSDFDREYIWNHQDQYLDKIAEVQYFEISKDKTGTESLRFPVFKHMRTDKTEPSLY